MLVINFKYIGVIHIFHLSIVVDEMCVISSICSHGVLYTYIKMYTR
jgi:hypothetical protein